jgi:hypothetical protein
MKFFLGGMWQIRVVYEPMQVRRPYQTPHILGAPSAGIHVHHK